MPGQGACPRTAGSSPNLARRSGMALTSGTCQRWQSGREKAMDRRVLRWIGPASIWLGPCRVESLAQVPYGLEDILSGDAVSERQADGPHGLRVFDAHGGEDGRGMLGARMAGINRTTWAAFETASIDIPLGRPRAQTQSQVSASTEQGAVPIHGASFAETPEEHRLLSPFSQVCLSTVATTTTSGSPPWQAHFNSPHASP